ncbi:hypothetical protein DM01DRAFT_1361634 [Hesseltinella vesiculosa]|uniref:Uncharacterized protein n=1 Tax=Hesseltinella vesiculosa TaxID=101127 RepID=A0A1X2GTB7_9FUNG|nr:hypothetical protein DM01DRAFT_1361634 [Hesseltinella vesiculosa]
MDDQSRVLIEQMLQEEEYYYGHNTLKTIRKNTKSEKRAAKKKPLPRALDKHGYGNWKPISTEVGTRNPLQCKNRAHHWLHYDKGKKRTSDVSPVPPSKPEPFAAEPPLPLENASASPNTDIKPKTNDTDDDISVDDNEREQGDQVPNRDVAAHGPPVSGDTQPSPPTTSLAPKQQRIHKQKAPLRDDTDFSRSTPSLIRPKKPLLEFDKDLPQTVLDTSSMEQQNPDDHVTQQQGPQFDPSQASEEEQKNCPEWFRHHHSKTPERYLKIRNHLLKCWRECQPRYLTKTSARRELRNCGDVNAIARVHEYLEAVGAININCTNPARPPVRHASRPENDLLALTADQANVYAAADMILGYDGPRKRKVRNENGEWVDPKDLEGRVIEHGVPKSEVTGRPKRIRRPQHHFYGGDDFGRGNDPFRLIPVEYYDDQQPAPFEVEISSHCLLVMDFHAHLAHTEIIGLLGGVFVTSQADAGGPSHNRLVVQAVFPCKSTSTGIQCEMDPASEMEARDVFAAKGLSVVGWYHSHPTFEPQPSVRDIENQTSYQSLFRRTDTGDEPFIGVIVTPYDASVGSNHSQIRYLHISKEWNNDGSFRMPYSCRRTIIQEHQMTPTILDQMKDMVDEYKDYEHKMDLLSDFGDQTRLDKLLDSLKSNLFTGNQDAEDFIASVRYLLMGKFVDQPEKSIDTHQDSLVEEA